MAYNSPYINHGQKGDLNVLDGGLVIILIVVVWLFVLAPLVLGNNSKPIRRSGEAYEDTRVLHQGGTEPMPMRRRPKLKTSRAHATYENETDTVEETKPEEEPVLIDDTEPRREKGTDSPRADEPEHNEALREADVSTPRKEAEVRHEPAVPEEPEAEVDTPPAGTTGSTAVSASDSTGGSSVVKLDSGSVKRHDEDSYHFDDTYLSTTDFGYEDTRQHEDLTEAPPAEKGEELDLPTELVEEESPLIELADDELTEEELAFAESRRGRGGWDPVADRTNQANRYQRRQRTFIALGVILVLMVILGIVLGGWWWILTFLVAGLLVWYLIALRNIVRQEQALRARRIRQLRRARLGVKSSDKEAPVPPELRRPGAIIVETDDPSPDFDHLPEAYSNEDHGGEASGSTRVTKSP